MTSWFLDWGLGLRPESAGERIRSRETPTVSTHFIFVFPFIVCESIHHILHYEYERADARSVTEGAQIRYVIVSTCGIGELPLTHPRPTHASIRPIPVLT